jgi:hypothetical protein
LAEIRRRFFAYVYQYDKFICFLFHRPPRISKRFTDCRMPLDLSDIELLGTPGQVEQACSKLDQEGWNSQKLLQGSVTWIRSRFMLGQFREEMLEVPFKGLTADRVTELK